jgi:hypothetical protein
MPKGAAKAAATTKPALTTKPSVAGRKTIAVSKAKPVIKAAPAKKVSKGGVIMRAKPMPKAGIKLFTLEAAPKATPIVAPARTLAKLIKPAAKVLISKAQTIADNKIRYNLDDTGMPLL